MPSNLPTPDKSPPVQGDIKNLIDTVQRYQAVRELRSPKGIDCPSYDSKEVIKRSLDDTN